jgi:hypothetical protein
MSHPRSARLSGRMVNIDVVATAAGEAGPGRKNVERGVLPRDSGAICEAGDGNPLNQNRSRWFVDPRATWSAGSARSVATNCEAPRALFEMS